QQGYGGAAKDGCMAVLPVPEERSPYPGFSGSGWRRRRGEPSLSEVFGSIETRPQGPLWRKLTAFLGPGYLVAVGYMDPGNWATSLAGGAKVGFAAAHGARRFDL